MNAAFFANAGSRSGDEDFESAKTALKEASIELSECQLFDNIEDFKTAVDSAVKRKVQIIIIGGGDGTMSLAIDSIVHSDSILAVLPLGTGNQFAKELGIDSELKIAVEVILNRRVCKIDVGDVNGNKFINVATIGISSDIANNLTLKKELGKLAYIPAVIQSLKEIKPFRVTLRHGEETTTREAVQLVVCNGRYHAGPFMASPEATLTDSCLDAYFVEPSNLWKMAQISTMALTGSHVSLEAISLVRAEKISVITEPKLPVTLDGETVWHDQLNFSCIPASLKVLVPQTFRAQSERIHRL